MHNKKYYLGAAVFGLLILVFFMVSGGAEVPAFVLERQDITETISATGRVEAGNRIALSFQRGGTVTDIMAVEGEYYEAGTSLMMLEKQEEENDLRARELQVAAARNDFSDLLRREQVARLQFESLQSQRQDLDLQYERNLQLFQLGGVSKRDLEVLELQLSEAKRREEVALLDYKSLAPGGSQRDRGALAIQTAENQRDRSRIEMNKKIITAPFFGQVLEVTKVPFSNAAAGEMVINFAEERSYIVADIDERDYNRLQPGQKAFIRLLNSQEVIAGTLRDVSPVIDRTKGTVRVRIDLPPEVRLKTDIGVNIEIVVQELVDQILIPREFFFQNPSRIILNQGGRSKVLLLEEVASIGQWILVRTPDMNAYLGQEIVARDIPDGQRIR